MNKKLKDDLQGVNEDRKNFIEALENMHSYLEFSADRSNSQECEYYLALRNYLEQIIRELQAQEKRL